MRIGRAGAPAVALLLMALSPLVVTAQGGPVPPGTPTTYVDLEGVEHGTVTVMELLDPFTAYPEGKDPEPGTKYVVVTLSIEGGDEASIEVYTPSIWIHDTAGGVWASSLPCCMMDEFPQPELTITTVGPGSRISGFMGYTVPEDAVIDQVLYQPESGVMLIPADLGTVRPAVGTPVTMARPDSTVVATVNTVTDPFKKFDKDRPPADGARYVVINASFENTGDTPFSLEQNGLMLRDARGALWGPTEVRPAKKSKVPDLDSAKLGPGNLVTGRLGFQVPADVELDGLYYQGDGGLFLLAGLAPGVTTPPVAVATCADMQPWWAEVQPLMARLTALPPFQDSAPAMDLAASEAMLTELTSIVDAHLAVTAPEPLLATHRQFLGALVLYEASARDQVTAQEDSDVARLFRSQETFEAAQLAAADALADLDELGFGDCETT